MRRIPSNIAEVLVKKRQIIRACKKTARWIDHNFAGQTPVIIGILKGSIPFYSNVFMRVKIDCMSDFLIASSYMGQRMAMREPEITLPNKVDLKGRPVIILEDIIDSGITIKFVKTILLQQGAASVHVVSLLDKPGGRKTDFIPDLSHFTCPNRFLVGFGLDDNEKMRNLPYVAILKDVGSL